jgi:hypothetical protein
MEPQKTVVEWWLKEGAVYGVAVVFLVFVLVAVLYGVFECIRLGRIYVPHWFEKNIESHEKICRSLDAFVNKLEEIHVVTGTTRDGMTGAIAAVNSHLKVPENRERLGVKSDVVFQLEQAEVVLKRGA